MTEPILLFGVSFDFVLFALTLFGIALFHRHTLVIALAGLAAITAYKLTFTGFNEGTGLVGLGFHLSHEFSLLSNLFLLLTGFALLSRHFEESAIPDEMLTDARLNSSLRSVRSLEVRGEGATNLFVGRNASEANPFVRPGRKR